MCKKRKGQLQEEANNNASVQQAIKFVFFVFVFLCFVFFMLCFFMFRFLFMFEVIYVFLQQVSEFLSLLMCCATSV